MIQREEININPSNYKPVSLYDPERRNEISFMTFIEDIYYSLIQNNTSLEILLKDYFDRSREVMILQEDLRLLRETVKFMEAEIQTLEAKVEILERKE